MAKERSYDYFWNSKSDRYYDADSMGDWLRPFFSNGVFNGQMQVTANGNMSVTIAAGYGYINGKHRHFLEPTTLDLEVASGTLNRIDAVMLRRDDTERRIYLLIEKGGNAKTPSAPKPTRRGAIYELKLADIYVAAGNVKITQAEITDTRMDSAVCGWVAATVKQIDFTQIQAQFNNYFTAWKQKQEIDFEEWARKEKEWFETVKDTLTSVENGELLTKIEKMLSEMCNMASQEDIDRILNETYVDIEDTNGFFETATTKDIDDIIGGTYVEQDENDDLFEKINVETIVEGAFKEV